MATMNTGISWTTSTWNPTTGCTKVSAGCDHCYAEALTKRLFGGGFDVVREHPNRLGQVRAFKPLSDDGGNLRPRLVFVNSMSDLFHRDISPAFLAEVFDGMETTPTTIYQVLTKRPMSLRRFIEQRYKASGVPAHIWLGVSVEDNRVSGRIDILRELKQSVGAFTAFLSVEPLIGLPDRHDYTAMDWVLIGGESGNGARKMEVDWARRSRDLSRKAGAATWFKQFGTWASNPLYVMSAGATHLDRVRAAIAGGEQKSWIDMKSGRPVILGEKGGATLDGQVLHEYPPHYHQLCRELAPSLF